MQGVVIEYSHNGWMTEGTALRWITVVWRRRYDDKRRLFSWDSYKCHLTNPVISALSQRNTDVVVVPGETTSLIQVSKKIMPYYACRVYSLALLIQAADVCWNKPFKSQNQALYDDWMANGVKTYT